MWICGPVRLDCPLCVCDCECKHKSLVRSAISPKMDVFRRAEEVRGSLAINAPPWDVRQHGCAVSREQGSHVRPRPATGDCVHTRLRPAGESELHVGRIWWLHVVHDVTALVDAHEGRDRIPAGAPVGVLCARRDLPGLTGGGVQPRLIDVIL